MGYAHERLHDVHGSLPHPFLNGTSPSNVEGIAFFGDPTMIDALEHQLQRVWLTTTISGPSFYYRWTMGERSLLCLYQFGTGGVAELLKTPGVLRCAFGGDHLSLRSALEHYEASQENPYVQSVLGNRATQKMIEPLECLAWLDDLNGLQTSKYPG